MANLSGDAVLLLLVVPLCMCTCALLVGVQLGRTLERRSGSVIVTLSIGEALGYVAAEELWDSDVSGRVRDEIASRRPYARWVALPLESSATPKAEGCNRNHTSSQPAQTILSDAQRRLRKQQQLMQLKLRQQQLMHQKSAPHLSPESSTATPEPQRCNILPSGMISIGPWGGSGGQPFYMHGGNASTSSLRGIILYHSSSAIHSLACEYSLAAGDGVYRMAAPWGRPPHSSDSTRLLRAKIILSAGEHVTAVEGTIGHFANVPGVVIASLTFRTSHGRTYGPYGSKAGTGVPFSAPAADGACVVGFWGRSGWLVDAIGVYVRVRPCSNPAYKYLSKPQERNF